MTKEIDNPITLKRYSALDHICQKFGVTTLYVFGSQVQTAQDWIEGRQGDRPQGPSDVDVGVRIVAGRKLSITEKVTLALALEDLFASIRVDLVILNEADPFLAAEVIRGERLFAQDKHEADEYDLYVLRRAGDLSPLERERIGLVLGETR